MHASRDDEASFKEACRLEAEGDALLAAGEPAAAHFRQAQAILMPVGRIWDDRAEDERRMAGYRRLQRKLYDLGPDGRARAQPARAERTTQARKPPKTKPRPPGPRVDRMGAYDGEDTRGHVRDRSVRHRPAPAVPKTRTLDDPIPGRDPSKPSVPAEPDGPFVPPPPDPIPETALARARARALIEQGDLAAAHEALRACVDPLGGMAHHAAEGHGYERAAAALAAAGQPAQARAFYLDAILEFLLYAHSPARGGSEPDGWVLAAAAAGKLVG